MFFKSVNFILFSAHFTLKSVKVYFLSVKEYATIDAIMADLNLTPFRIKVDRIFNGLNFIREKHLCLK